MATNDRSADKHKGRPGSLLPRLLAVCIWTEEVGGAVEYRGNVRDVVNGSFRGSRQWPDFAAFMTQHLEDAFASEGAQGDIPWR